MIPRLFRWLNVPRWAQIFIATMIALPAGVLFTAWMFVINATMYGKFQTAWEQRHTSIGLWGTLMQPATRGWVIYAAVGILVFWTMFFRAVWRNPGWFDTFNPIANAWVMALPRWNNTRQDQRPRSDPWLLGLVRKGLIIFYATNMLGIFLSGTVVLISFLGAVALGAILSGGLSLVEQAMAFKRREKHPIDEFLGK